MPTRKSQGGFTLAEVLIAIAILAIISTLVWGSFARVFESQEVVTRIQERYHGVRLALSRMAREISMAFIYECRELNTSTGERRYQTIFKVDPASQVDRITFSSFSHLRMTRDVNESDQNVLSYFAREDPDDADVTNLVRSEKVRIDGDPEEEGNVMILCHDIESLHFKMWDRKKKDWVEEWDCSQVEHLNQLPHLVRISLSAMDENDQELNVSTITRIFTTKALANWMQASQ
jgi:general secretion pathway protein J